MILTFNGKPVADRDELVRMVVATKPGTTVPVRIVRDRQERSINVTVDELDLEAESTAVARNRERDGSGADEPPASALRLENISPADARELRLESHRGARSSPTSSRAARRPGRPAAGRRDRPRRSRAVTSMADAQRELGRVPSRGTAFLRVMRDGQETFVPVTKD